MGFFRLCEVIALRWELNCGLLFPTQSSDIHLTVHGKDDIIKKKLRKGKTGENMEPKDYTVVKIEGEYAYLRADGDTEGQDLFIALALLPGGVDVGTRLHCEMLSYTIIE